MSVQRAFLSYKLTVTTSFAIYNGFLVGGKELFLFKKNFRINWIIAHINRYSLSDFEKHYQLENEKKQ